MLTVIIVNGTGSLQTYSGLYSMMMPMSAPNRIIYAINVENTFNWKRNYFFDYRKVTTFVGKCFQVDEMSHKVLDIELIGFSLFVVV